MLMELFLDLYRSQEKENEAERQMEKEEKGNYNFKQT